MDLTLSMRAEVLGCAMRVLVTVVLLQGLLWG